MQEMLAPYILPAFEHKLPFDLRGRFDPSLWTFDPNDHTVLYAKAIVEDAPPAGHRELTVYCIDVEEVHNFATVAGIVHNCMPPGMAFGDFLERLDVQHRKAKREWKWLAAEAKKRGEEPPPPPEPPLTPQAACRPRLIRDIEESGAKTILAIGNRALEAVAEIEGTTLGAKPKQRPDGSWTPQIMTLKEQHGAPVDLGNGRTLMSAYHPAGAAKGKREMLPIIQENMERAARVATSGWSWPEPNFWIFPSPDEVITLLDALVAQGVELIVDIETGPSEQGRKDAADVRRNFIRCIGVGARCITSESTGPSDLRELVFVIPVRHMDKTLWYSEADTERVRRACQRAFDHLPLVGQNFQFDTSVLFRDGYIGNPHKPWTDTLVLHKNSCDNDLPHNLSFITRQFFTLPVWKGVDHNSWNNDDDRGLHVYCLHGDTPIVLADGSTERIKNIVRHNKPAEVLSLSAGGRMEARRVVNWHRNRVPGQDWWRLRLVGEKKSAKGLVQTPDHKVMVEDRGWVRMDNVEPGDRLFLPEPALVGPFRQALLGTLFGDSTIAVSPSHRKDPANAPTAYVQGGHEATCQWARRKAEKMSGFIKLGKPFTRTGDRSLSRLKKAETRFQPFTTRSTRELRELALRFKVEGRRVVDVQLLRELGPVGWAWWFCDDGCLQKKSSSGRRETVCLSLLRYSVEDQLLVRDEFRRLFGPCEVYQGVLRALADSSEVFASAVAPHVPPELRYKLPQNLDYPSYDDAPFDMSRPATWPVELSEPFEPPKGRRDQKLLAETRWCITVEGNHNFFTSFGLTHNCGKDIVTTMRVLPILRERTAEYECVPQYRVDEALAPVCRNMSAIGIPVNEHKRGEFSKHFNEQCIVHQQKADEILGREINLNSPDQLRDLFYGDTKFGGWGLTPRIATDGYEWDPDKEGSTGGQALVELRKAGLEEFQTRFIDNLFDFRSYSKLKGTYTDNLPLYPAEFDISNIPDAPEVHGFYADPEGVVHTDTGMVVLPKRRGMSVFHPTFKNYVVPGGRLSASPNVQAIPAIGKANIREMFEAPPGHVFVGADWSQLEARIYAIVSGDEVLIDTIKGHHEVTGDSLDIHTMNAASLFATNTSKEERMYWYNKIEYGVGLPFVGDLELPVEKIKAMTFADALQATKDFIAEAAQAAGWKDPASAWEKIRRKYRKRLRTIAKRFCVAEGTEVLTSRGPVPIEDVQRSDLVWDGVEWVKHDGVVFQGYKEVIEYDGVRATPDHEVFVDGKKVQLQEARDRGLAIDRPEKPSYVTSSYGETGPTPRNWFRAPEAAATRLARPSGRVDDETRCGVCGRPVRALGGGRDAVEGEGWQAHQGAAGVSGRTLRPDAAGVEPGQPEKRQEHRMPEVHFNEVQDSALASRAHQSNGAALYESKPQSLRDLRRSRHRVPVREPTSCGGVDRAELGAAQGHGDRSDRCRRALRTWQPSVGNVAREQGESTSDAVFRRRPGHLHWTEVADDSADGSATVERGVGSGCDYCACEACGRDEEQPSLASGRDAFAGDGRVAIRVFDILNAGPRRRFTVLTSERRTRLVSNCFLVLYGGEKEKLYSVMSADRDKVTGELTFKDLTPDECLFWYDNWHDSHPWTHQWHVRTADEVKKTGCIRVPILDNRARWFIHGASKKNAIPNHQIQGSAASLANDCLLKIAEAIPFRAWSPHSGLCLQVHDDIKVIVPENRAEQAAAILSGIMNRTWGGIDIPAEVVISRVWADQDKDGFVLDDLPAQVWA